MILFVATTGPPFGVAIGGGGTSVAELVMEEREVDEDEVYAVVPESCDERELWLIVWLRLDRPLLLLTLFVENIGAVFVLARGP
jgi:hypothetical protein